MWQLDSGTVKKADTSLLHTYMTPQSWHCPQSAKLLDLVIRVQHSGRWSHNKASTRKRSWVVPILTSWITSDRFAATPGREHKEVPRPGYLKCTLVCIFRSASIWGQYTFTELIRKLV